MTDDEVIDSSIDNVIVEENRLHALVGEMNERSVVRAKEVTKRRWRSKVAPLDMNYGRERLSSEYL